MSALPGASGTARSASVPIPSSRYWLIVLARAVVALGLGLAITFSSDHAARLGLIVFGVFAVVTAAIETFALLSASSTSVGRGTKALDAARPAVTLAAGIVALTQTHAGIVALVVILGAFGLLTGGMELTVGILTRRSRALARDEILVGAAAIVLGVVVLLIPTGLAAPFSGVEKGVSGVLTASIIVVGLLGAWGVITGVLLAIAAVTVRGARSVEPPAASAAVTTPTAAVDPARVDPTGLDPTGLDPAGLDPTRSAPTDAGTT